MTTNQIKKNELENELSTSRVENRDSKLRINDLNTKIQELQRNILDIQNGKNRSEDRAHELDKVNKILTINFKIKKDI